MLDSRHVEKSDTDLTSPTLSNQVIHSLLCNPRVHFRVHKILPVDPILSHTNPIVSLHFVIPNFILVLSSHLRLVVANGPYLQGVRRKIMYSFPTSVLHV